MCRVGELNVLYNHNDVSAHCQLASNDSGGGSAKTVVSISVTDFCNAARYKKKMLVATIIDSVIVIVIVIVTVIVTF